MGKHWLQPQCLEKAWITTNDAFSQGTLAYSKHFGLLHHHHLFLHLESKGQVEKQHTIVTVTLEAPNSANSLNIATEMLKLTFSSSAYRQ